MRYRVVADMMSEKDITDMEMNQISETGWVLVNTAAVIDVDGVDPDLRVERVHSMHVHESTEDHLCGGCRSLSMDMQNSDT